MTTRDKTPAQLYSLLFGVTLLVVGVLGFIADSSFGSGTNVNGSDFIIFEVNGWHNLVHIASGLLGLALWSRRDTARLYALGFGAVYLAVTIWGFIDGNSVLWLIPVDRADNVLHLLIAATGIAAGLASPASREHRGRTTAAPAR
jgi:heme/copper-type cytochrome/quinol oxidase subunit 3